MEKEMHQSGDSKFIPMTSVSSRRGRAVTPDVFYYTNQIVNLIFVGYPSADHWVLIDAGMPGCGKEIVTVAENRFGKNTKPGAILLTHGHFDHVGSIVYLVEKWDVPVYAHSLEFPYLTGSVDYPEPDPTVEGGLLAKIASVYPHEAIDISPVLHALPDDGTVPHLPGWRWIPVPGHSPGQVAFFREEDRLLISADAVVTVRQDSLYKILLQKQEINGPPRYFTTDWSTARKSVMRLKELHPSIMIPGHGTAMSDLELTDGLDCLANHFDELALPSHGRYVEPH